MRIRIALATASVAAFTVLCITLPAGAPRAGALSADATHHAGERTGGARHLGAQAGTAGLGEQIFAVTETATSVLAAPPPPPSTDATSTDTADWACIRMRESGDRYNSEAAPSGAYGIVEGTWESYGNSGWPYEAPAASQDALALRLYNEYGWAPWSSRFACGL